MSWSLYIPTLLGQLQNNLVKIYQGILKHIYKHKYDRKAHLAGDPKRKG